MKNWKTTTLGVLIIVGAIINAAIHWLQTGALPEVSTLWPAVLGGWGLLHTADANPTPPPPAKKIVPLVALGLIVSSMAGCAWMEAHKPQLKATAGVVAQRAASVAVQTLISYAVDESDRGWKADHLDLLADNLRANAGNIVTSGDVEQIVRIWSPNDGARWQALAAGVAQVAQDELATQGKDQAAAVVEQIATGLQSAAAQAKPATP